MGDSNMTTTFDTASIESTANYTWYMLTHEGDLSPTQIDYLYGAMRDLRIRDEVIRLTVQQQDVRPVWTAIAHHLSEVMDSSTVINGHAGTTMAIMAWLDGDDDWAFKALHKVLDADPDHSLAHLVHRCIESGLPPQVWLAGMSGMTRAMCLHLTDKEEQS
jgi:hypothetical protein